MFTSKDLCLEHPHYHNGIEYTNSDWDPNSYEFFERLSGTRMEPIASLFPVSIFYCMTYFYEMTRLLASDWIFVCCIEYIYRRLIAFQISIEVF